MYGKVKLFNYAVSTFSHIDTGGIKVTGKGTVGGDLKPGTIIQDVTIYYFVWDITTTDLGTPKTVKDIDAFIQTGIEMQGYQKIGFKCENKDKTIHTVTTGQPRSKWKHGWKKNRELLNGTS